jgi:hypothetical protein
MFKKPDPNKKIQTVDLTEDARQPAIAPAVVIRELAKA